MTALEQYLPIETAGRQFGVPYRTLRKRVIDRTLQTYRNDRDRRVTLVKLTIWPHCLRHDQPSTRRRLSRLAPLSTRKRR